MHQFHYIVSIFSFSAATQVAARIVSMQIITLIIKSCKVSLDSLSAAKASTLHYLLNPCLHSSCMLHTI